MIEKLHYISQQGKSGETHAEMIASACENGIKWVQLRMKNHSEENIRQTALKCLEICKKWNVPLILNDYVHIAAEIGADGVHLGQNDMPVDEARKILGSSKIIGGTANTLDDMKLLTEKGVDYIGLGPLRYTKTKENLSPVLGFDGYTTFLKEYNKIENPVPVIAIGGIELSDISNLKSIGLYGVAVASGINYSKDKKSLINSYLNSLNS